MDTLLSNCVRAHFKTSDHPSDGIYRFSLPRAIQSQHSSTIALEKVDLPANILAHCEPGKEDYSIQLDYETRKASTWRKWQTLWEDITTNDGAWRISLLSGQKIRNWYEHDLSRLRSLEEAPTLEELCTELNIAIVYAFSERGWDEASSADMWPQFAPRRDPSKGLALRLPKLRKSPVYHIEKRDIRFQDRTAEEEHPENRIYHIDDIWVYFPFAHLLAFMGIDLGWYRATRNHPVQFEDVAADILPIIAEGERNPNHITNKIRLNLEDLLTRPTEKDFDTQRKRVILDCTLTFLPLAVLQSKLSSLVENTSIQNLQLNSRGNSYYTLSLTDRKSVV